MHHRGNYDNPNHFPELLNDVLFAFACDDINRQVIGRSMNFHHAPLGIADVKLHLSSEVEECTESHCTMNDDEVVCTIEGTSILVVVGVIVVPADILPASLVDATNLFAQTIDNVVLDVQPSTDALPFFETDQQGTFTYSLSENDSASVDG